MTGSIIILLAGLVILTVSGDQFVNGSARLAKVLRLSPVVVGAVVLGFGTSAPELVVSASAALRGDPALGVGNIIGSNVANLSLGLGLAAVLAPVICSRSLLRKEAAMSVGSTMIFALLVLDGNLALWEGIVLAVLLVVAITVLIRTAERAPAAEPEPITAADADIAASSSTTNGATSTTDTTATKAPGHVPKNILRAILGLAGVLIGAQLAVSGSTDLADRFGLSTGFVGFSIVAIGTSLPELATVAAAARKGHTQLILGNLLGSNLFNSLAVSGAMGLVGTGAIGDTSLTQLGIAVMVGVSLIAYAMAYTKGRVGRTEGVALLVLYVAATVLLATT